MSDQSMSSHRIDSKWKSNISSMKILFDPDANGSEKAASNPIRFFVLVNSLRQMNKYE